MPRAARRWTTWSKAWTWCPPCCARWTRRPAHRLEGRELQEVLHGLPDGQPWRDCVYSELDYSFRQARLLRGKTPRNARAWSLRTDRWRYVYWLDEPEQLYDLQADPEEFRTWGPAPRTPRCAGPCATVCWNGCCAAAPAR